MASEITRAEIETLIRKYASQFGVPLDLAMALAGSESSFNPQARGPVIPKTGRRALGLFQIYSEDVKKKYNITNPLDAEQNIRGGLNFFGDLLKDYKGDVPLALSAFNAGKGRMADYGGGVPPFPGLKKYISDITSETAQGTGSTGIGFPWPEERGMPPGQGPAAAPQIQGPQMPPDQTTPLAPWRFDPSTRPTGFYESVIARPARQISTLFPSPEGPVTNDMDYFDRILRQITPIVGRVKEAFKPEMERLGGQLDPYLASAQGRFADPTKPPGVYATADSEESLKQQWIYKTAALASDRMVDDEGQPLPADDPDREGILISFTGEGPTEDEIDRIFHQVDPQGMITREDAATLSAAGTSIVGGTKRAAALVRRIAPYATKGVPGLPLLTGIAGAGGEYWRQSQVPKNVDRFGIESWPKSRFGFRYEGAPDSAAERSYAMLVSGLQEAVGEGLFRGLAKGIQKAGRWWQSRAYEKTAIDEARRLGIEGAEVLAREGINPTLRSVNHAGKMADASAEAGEAILRESEEVLGPITIKTDDVLKEVNEALGQTAQERVVLNQPSLRNALDGIEESIRAAGGETGEVTLTQADRLRRQANLLAGNAATQAAKIPSPDSAKAVASAANDVEQAVATAFTNQTTNALRFAEQNRGVGAWVGSKVPWTGSPGRIRGFLPGGKNLFARRWRDQAKSTQQWQWVRQTADEKRKQGLGGLALGALSIGVGPSALASLTGLASAVPPVAALSAVGASQLFPLVQSLTGGAIYKGGHYAGRTLPNIARGIFAHRTPGGLAPRPEIPPSEGFPGQTGVMPRPMFNFPPFLKQ